MRKRTLIYADHREVDDPMHHELTELGRYVLATGQSPDGRVRQSARRAKAIKSNLLKKVIRGKYDKKKAVKAWEYLASDLDHEYGEGSDFRSGKATRRAVAEDLARDFDKEIGK